MKPNRLLLPIIVLLVVGLIFISISSITEALNTTNDQFFFIKKQFIWSAIGLLSFGVASKISLKNIQKYSWYLYLGSTLLLALTLIPSLSNSALGARRWLDLGIVGIQPSEIFKLAAIIFFASFLSHQENRQLKYIFYYLIIPLGLIILEPNMSTTILITSIIITLFYLSGGSLNSILILCLLAISASTILIFTSPYRRARFESNSYHSNQMTLALSSGHLTGKGFANSDQKYRYLPKISTDSILAVIGEETGLVGLTLIIITYYYLLSAIFTISNLQIEHSFEALLCQGIGCWIGFQSLINMSAVVSIIPLTGVTLPLISYGGSSLVMVLFSLGLINNLIYSKQNETRQNHRHHR